MAQVLRLGAEQPAGDGARPLRDGLAGVSGLAEPQRESRVGPRPSVLVRGPGAQRAIVGREARREMVVEEPVERSRHARSESVEVLDEDRRGAVLDRVGDHVVEDRGSDVGVPQHGVELDEGERSPGLFGSMAEQGVHQREVKDVGERGSTVDASVPCAVEPPLCFRPGAAAARVQMTRVSVKVELASDRVAHHLSVWR